jgi:microcystin degradation protein MlrC
VTRLFAASLATETNTFSPIPTGRGSFEAAFYAPPCAHPDEPKLCTGPLIAARRRAAQERFTLIEGSCFWAEPSGTLSNAGWASMRDEILAQVRAALPLDGLLMGFHGALVAEGVEDAEGEMLTALREIVGPDCVIGAEYDPHCHLTARRVGAADVTVLFKEYPHVDFLDRADELLTLVLSTIRGEVRPVASLYDPRLWDFYPTTHEPGRGFVDRMKALEGRDGVLSVSLAHGFMHADVPDMGSRVLVIADALARPDAKAHGDALAERLGRELWDRRGTWSEPAAPLEETLDRALAVEGPVIVAEPPDNAGGGATSDNTDSLHALLRRGVGGAAVAPMWDPMAVGFAHEAGLGAQIALRIGGKASAGSGAPVDAEVEIVGLARDAWQHFGAARVPLGDAAAVRIATAGGAVDVVLISSRTQALGTELFTQLGLDPAGYRLLCLKSAQHFAGAFGPLARAILRAETGGACPTTPHGHAYRRLSRPLWPLDETVEGRLVV